MFKRSGALLLTMLYIVTVVGFALNLHYCGKLIMAVKIDAPVKDCNGDQMMMMPGKMKCCKNKRVEIKINDAHQTEPFSILSKLFSVHLPKAFSAYHTLTAQQAIPQSFLDRGPPGYLSNKVPVFIKNCTFLI